MNNELRAELSSIADSLVPVAGELMHCACGDRVEHLEGCDCNTCQAFLTTQAAITKLEKLCRSL